MVALMPRTTLSITGSGAERRMFPRKEVSVRVEGRRLDHSVEARQMPQLSLQLKDVSLGGIAALSNTPVGRGERITVFFPPEGPARGWDVRRRAGTTIACPLCVLRGLFRAGPPCPGVPAAGRQEA